ncbi:MAG: hypothetical protein AAB263_17025, partial [Planctomycetota bacterium]
APIVCRQRNSAPVCFRASAYGLRPFRLRLLLGFACGAALALRGTHASGVLPPSAVPAHPLALSLLGFSASLETVAASAAPIVCRQRNSAPVSWLNLHMLA